MKRMLNHDRYTLDDAGRESTWHAIRRETHGAPERPWSRGSFRPALAVTALAAVLMLATAWQLGGRRALEHPGGDDILADRGPSEAVRPAPDLMVVLEESEPAPVAKSAAPAARPVESMAAEAAPPPPAPVLTGRVLDRITGEPLQHVSVLIRGTNLSAITDTLGVFRFEGLAPGQDLQLAVRMLSYEPVDVALTLPSGGEMVRDVSLEPMVVATLQALDVDGAEYMVEIKSAVTEHTVGGQTLEKYAIDSVDDALSKQAGVVSRAGELHERGGRSGNVPLPVAPMAEPAPGSVTGGTTPPNGDQVELMYFETAGVNPFVATEDDALSTFALDVDNASWTMARNYLTRGMLPPTDAIRVEEFVNAFDAGWEHHTDTPFRIHTEGAASRFGDGYHLLRIGLVGMDVDDGDRKPANLVFVIDVSGSMNRESRLGTVKNALHILLGELREGDRVGIVVYGSRGEVRLPLTDIDKRERIIAAIDALEPAGSTNAAEGLELAYAMARESYDAGVINRLILCSDGVANTGRSTEAGGILDQVRRASDEGITLSTIGFGMGNYNDVLMEKLADRGDGNYYYVDRLDEAERVFRENLTGMLQTIAREVKVQVEFDPAQVQRWRLLGYENRDVADRDFRNDKVDAGEVGAGHQVTALYELKLKQAPGGSFDDDDDLWPGSTEVRVATVRLRHEAPAHDTARAGQVTEIEEPVLLTGLAGDFGSGTPWMRVQTVVAEFAELLRGSYWAREHSFAELVPVADALARELPGQAQVQDLARMVRQAADIEAAQNEE